MSVASQLRLFILDEVHLLNDDRGAVIETLVARTQRQACDRHVTDGTQSRRVSGPRVEAAVPEAPPMSRRSRRRSA